MRPSSCLLSVTLLSAGVSAFVPYSVPNKKVSPDSSTSQPDRRFVPFSFSDGDGGDGADDGNGEHGVPTLHIKKGSGPSMVSFAGSSSFAECSGFFL